jgi:threonine aldolase
MARRLSERIVAGGGRLAWPADGNEVFAILPRTALARARDAGAVFHEWPAEQLPAERRPGADEDLVRLVASFATSEEEVERFLAVIASG